ncbi:MAG: ankyrin repeat domain-containing protein [Rubrivivax sp.]
MAFGTGDPVAAAWPEISDCACASSVASRQVQAAAIRRAGVRGLDARGCIRVSSDISSFGLMLVRQCCRSKAPWRTSVARDGPQRSHKLPPRVARFLESRIIANCRTVQTVFYAAVQHIQTPTERVSLMASISGSFSRLRDTLLALGLSLAAHGAWAQAVTNPNLSAQLLVAARQGDLAQIERTLSQGAAPNARNRLGKTPLLIACEKGNEVMAARMLMAGADVNLASLERVTPLMAASYGGHATIVKRLLAAGAKTDPIDRMHKSALVYAAAQGHAAVVDQLIASGVDVDTVDEHRLTALMWAAGQGQADTVKLLVSRRARLELKDDRGLTALDIARATGNDSVAALLPARP